MGCLVLHTTVTASKPQKYFQDSGSGQCSNSCHKYDHIWPRCIVPLRNQKFENKIQFGQPNRWQAQWKWPNGSSSHLKKNHPSGLQSWRCTLYTEDDEVARVSAVIINNDKVFAKPVKIKFLMDARDTQHRWKQMGHSKGSKACRVGTSVHKD